MIKFPKIQFFIFFSLFLCFSVPYYFVTWAKHDKGEARPHIDYKNDKKKINVWVSLLSVHKPEKISLRCNGEQLFTLSKKKQETEFFLPIKNDKSAHLRLNFTLFAQWQANIKQSAVKIIVEPDGLETKEITFWAENFIDKQFDFSWKKM